jgi:hypothetical protein
VLFLTRYLIRRVVSGPFPPTPEFDADEQLRIKDTVLRDARERLLRDGDWRVAKQAVRRLDACRTVGSGGGPDLGDGARRPGR